jgi:hypothetical protein
MQEKLERAAMALREADGLVISAGAGMGVDSGLPDFRGDQGFWKGIRSRYGIVTPGKRDKKSRPPNISLDRQVLFSPSATGEAVFGGVPLGPRPQFSC